jgi:SRSO17 transposase
MDERHAKESAERLARYLGALADALGDTRRVQPMTDYCAGLLLPCERKSVEPIAAVTAPMHTSAKHQSLMHFVSESPWADEAILAKVREQVLPAMQKHGTIEVWIIDETSFPKCGSHSVGVAHQYCGHLGKQANCQVAVSLSLANHDASLPVAWQLYLPKTWAEDPALREKAGVPAGVVFETKPKIALKQIEMALKYGLPRGVVLGDVVYGADLSLRKYLRAHDLVYSLAIQARTLVAKVDGNGEPLNAAELAKSLPRRGWRTIGWRDGSNASLSSRFQRVRVKAAGEGTSDDEPAEWLIVEWPKSEKEPTKFWLSTLPADCTMEHMIDITMMRWRIERDYLELKQEVGLDHFEGRSWRGFHHHATMCIAAYGFLISERSAFSPSAERRPLFSAKPALPEGFKARGSPASN